MTTSLELSKALKEAGFEQGIIPVSVFTEKPQELDEVRTSGFYWVYHNSGWLRLLDAEEILKELPTEIEGERLRCLVGFMYSAYWGVGYSGTSVGVHDGVTLSDAAAACWLYLKSHNLL